MVPIERWLKRRRAGQRLLFNERILFLHVPKAAGTSVTSFLIRNLRGSLTLTEPANRLTFDNHVPPAVRIKLSMRRLRRQLGLMTRPSLRIVEGARHETLREARAALAHFGRKLDQFDSIVAIVRNPYDLEVSRYHFFRRGHMGVPGLAREVAEELALAGDFAAFAKRAPYHGCLPGQIEDWFEIDGRMPANMRVIKFENLEQELTALIPSASVFTPLPKLNASAHGPYRAYLTREIEEAIYRKFQWLFERGYYGREVLES